MQHVIFIFGPLNAPQYQAEWSHNYAAAQVQEEGYQHSLRVVTEAKCKQVAKRCSSRTVQQKQQNNRSQSLERCLQVVNFEYENESWAEDSGQEMLDEVPQQIAGPIGVQMDSRD